MKVTGRKGGFYMQFWAKSPNLKFGGEYVPFIIKVRLSKFMKFLKINSLLNTQKANVNNFNFFNFHFYLIFIFRDNPNRDIFGH